MILISTLCFFLVSFSLYSHGQGMMRGRSHVETMWRAASTRPPWSRQGHREVPWSPLQNLPLRTLLPRISHSQKSFWLRMDKVNKCPQGMRQDSLLPHNTTCSRKPLSKGVFEMTAMEVPPLIPINHSDPVSAGKYPLKVLLESINRDMLFKPLLDCLVLLAKEQGMKWEGG